MRKPRIPHVKAGDPITADLFNEVSERLERFANLSTSSPYVLLDDGPHGKSIALALPQQTWALLSGASSPYSFTEVRDGPGGTWVSMPNGDSGTANVYEINGKSGLAGKVVPITWTAAGDWRFQWVGYGPPPPCESGRICVTVQATGCGLALTGVTITVKDSDEVVVGSGTTSGSPGKFCFDLPTAGTYTVISSVPGLADLTTSVNAVCGIDNNVTFTYPTNSVGILYIICKECDCSGNYGVAASVSVSGPGTGSITTDAGTGEGGITVKASTAYSVTAVYPSGFSETLNFQSVPPCGTTFVTFQSILSVSIAAVDCAPGCEVTFTASGPATGSCTATESGLPLRTAQCCLVLSNPITARASGLVVTITTTPGGFHDGQTIGPGSCWSTASPFVLNFGGTC